MAATYTWCLLIDLCLIRPFSSLQLLRHEFVPGTPACLADVENTKVVFKRSPLPIKDELKQMFPTLLSGGSEGMQQLEICVDNENGSILRSQQPLRVSFLFIETRNSSMQFGDVISQIWALIRVFDLWLKLNNISPRMSSTFRLVAYYQVDRLLVVTTLSWVSSTWSRSYTQSPSCSAFWLDLMVSTPTTTWKSRQSTCSFTAIPVASTWSVSNIKAA